MFAMLLTDVFYFSFLGAFSHSFISGFKVSLLLLPLPSASVHRSSAAPHPWFAMQFPTASTSFESYHLPFTLFPLQTLLESIVDTLFYPFIGKQAP
jgi:hypothetical protein